MSLTSNVTWADAPGNVRLTAKATGLSRESVANVSQIVTIDKAVLTERVGKLSAAKLELVLSGIMARARADFVRDIRAMHVHGELTSPDGATLAGSMSRRA